MPCQLDAILDRKGKGGVERSSLDTASTVSSALRQMNTDGKVRVRLICYPKPLEKDIAASIRKGSSAESDGRIVLDPQDYNHIVFAILAAELYYWGILAVV